MARLILPLFCLFSRITVTQACKSSELQYTYENTGPQRCINGICIYSNPTYADGTGIVAITTVHHWTSILNMSDELGATHPMVEVREIPGKGLGLVTTQPLRRGQRIMSESPVAVFHQSLLDAVDQEDQEQLVQAAINMLPPSTRRKFSRQIAHSGRNSSLDILFTNGFNAAISLLSDADRAATSIGSHHFASWPSVSRFNHDCRPNVAYHIDSSLRHITHAVRDIAAGEELTISYLDPFRARQVRQDRTQRAWGFACACHHCSLPEPLVNASDYRLWKIYELENALGDWESDATIDRDGNLIELLVSLYRQERLLDSHGAEAYRLAAMNYNALGKPELAMKYALLGLEQVVMENGIESKHVAMLVQLSQDPKSHWTSRKRL